nr:hypothetical protein [Tanacetum cinerariifolium]
MLTILWVASNGMSLKDVYSRKRIIAVISITIMKRYDYNHLDEIKVRREDQQLYKFNKGDFTRLRLQDIEDMLLLLVQQKLTNLTIDERFDLNVALRNRKSYIEARVLNCIVQKPSDSLFTVLSALRRSGIENKQISINYKSNLIKMKFKKLDPWQPFRIEVKQFREMLLQHMTNVKKSVDERTRHQRHLVVTESSGTESGKQDTSSRPRNDTDVDDADIRPIYDEKTTTEVQLTAECNIFAIGQQHTEQPEIINEGWKAPIMMPSARFQSIADDSKPKPRSTNHSTRSLPVSKSSCVTIKAVPIADHSKSSSSFLDSKHFVCSTCHKCIFNANHDACITTFLKEVNSRATI